MKQINSGLRIRWGGYTDGGFISEMTNRSLRELL